MKTLHVMGMDFAYKASFKAYSSAIVERIWNGIGKLTVELNSGITNSTLIEENDILWFDDETQSYIVEKITEKLDGSELTLEIVAPAVESLLADFITIPPVGGYDTINGTREAVVRNWVANNCINPTDVSRAAYPITLGNLNGFGQSITEQTRYKNLLEEVQRILLAEDLGFELARGDNEFIFNVIQGVDKTSTSLSMSTRIVFGLKYGNISGYTRTKDVSPYKNVAYVAGQGEGEERNIIKVVGQTGIRRKEVFVDARDTNEAAMLLERGEQSLTVATPVDTFEFEALNKQFEYKKDYDLGDFVTIVIDSSNHTDKQIKKITEIYERGNIRIVPEFGKLEKTMGGIMSSVSQRISRLETAELSSSGEVVVTGDKSYTHEQQVAATQWTVNHNLGKYPAIKVRDTSGNEMECGVRHISNQQVVLTFNMIVSGYADCN